MGVFKNRLKRIEEIFIVKEPVEIIVTHGSNLPADFKGIIVSGDPRPANIVYKAREIVKSVDNKVSSVVKNDSTDEPESSQAGPKKEKITYYRGMPVNPEKTPAEKPEAKKQASKGPEVVEVVSESMAASQHGHWD